MSVSLSYGRQGRLSCEIDPRRIMAAHRGPPACQGLAGKIRAALEKPLDFPSLVQVCVPGDRVVVALDRHTPGAAELIAEIWPLLELRNVTADAIQVLQPAALDAVPLVDPRGRLPESVRNQVQWTVHDPTDQRRLAYLAATARGERIYMARELVDADVVISVGMMAYDPVLG